MDGDDARSRGRRQFLLQTAATVLGASVVGTLAVGAPPAGAEGDPPVVGTVLRAANTDGETLNLRAGPGTSQPIVARLRTDTTFTVTGQSQIVGTTLWVPVTSAGGYSGWVAAQYTSVVSVPTPTPTPTAELVAAVPEPTLPPPMPSPIPLSTAPVAPEPAEEAVPGPLEIEVKIKYPEAKGRHQEVTIWVTRKGQPVSGALVTLRTSTDDDDELPRELEPTDEDGRTRREFTAGKDKGEIELEIVATAPDGGEGRTIARYFRR